MAGSDSASSKVGRVRRNGIIPSSRRGFLKLAGSVGLATGISGCLGGGPADERQVQTLTYYGEAQDDQQQYRLAQIYREGIEALGFDVEYQGVSDSLKSQKLSHELDYDIGHFTHSGRPSRLDPGSFGAKLFHKRETPVGTNNGRYTNDTVSALFDEQATTVDRDERAEILKDVQAKVWNLPDDQPDDFADCPAQCFPAVHPSNLHVLNTDRWTGQTSIPGLGLKNYWNFVNMEPTGDDSSLVTIWPAGMNKTFTPLGAGVLVPEMTMLIHDHLTRVGEDGLAAPCLATDWEYSNGGETITYTLREGHSFHDGEPVTAEDVAWTYNWLKEIGAPTYQSGLTLMKDGGAEVIDETTVAINFEEANAAWEVVTSSRIRILPKHIWEQIAESIDTQPWLFAPTESDEFDLIGSGPFQLEHHRRGDEVLLSANPDHWDAPAYDELIVKVITNPSSVQGSLKNEEAHFLGYTEGIGNPDLLKQLGEDNDHLEFSTHSNIGFWKPFVNTSRPPFTYPKVRAAVACSLDQETMLQEGYGGYGEVAFGWVHPDMGHWFNQDLTDYTQYGPEDGRELLQEAGFEIVEDTVYYPEGEVPTEEEKNKVYEGFEG